MMKRPRFSPEVRDRAVRLVQDHQSEYSSQWGAITSIAVKIGCSPESLRKWVHQAERDPGRRPGLATEEQARLKALSGARNQAVLRVSPDGEITSVYDVGTEVEPAGCRGEFCRRTLATVSPSAEVTGVARWLSEDADSIRYQVRAFHPNGTSIFTTVLAFPQQTIPREVLDSVAQAQASERGRPDVVAYTGAPRSGGTGASGTEDVAPEIATYPPLRAMVIGRDGSVWLERFVDRHWVVLTPDGALEQEVSLGPRTILHAVAGDALWAVRYDADDVPSVVRLVLGIGRTP